MSHLRFHLVRHVPVKTPGGFWYGAEIETDLVSPSVKDRFNYLAGILPLDKAILISSPYPRSQQTASGVLQAAKLDFIPTLKINSGFAEQNYGDMAGKFHADISHEDHVKSYLEDTWNNPPRNGESLQMFQSRVAQSLDGLVATTPLKKTEIVIFCHGGVQLAALANARKIRMSDLMQERKTDKSLTVAYMSVISLEYSRTKQEWSREFKIDPGLKPIP